MISLINLLKIILIKVVGLLPDSPFTMYINDIDSNFFQYLNWFLPLDICLNIFLSWIACMGVLLIIYLVKKYLVNKLINVLMTVGSYFV